MNVTLGLLKDLGLRAMRDKHSMKTWMGIAIDWASSADAEINRLDEKVSKLEKENLTLESRLKSYKN
ncbi:MAG: hypothetical protein GQ540_03305 [Lutibacter sp.]|uniref:hypothetical protein n=1 Tax=Lutibacter sp. TaxID=1925666 RepID=UPI001A01A8A9|nr:hypothetical protein [Lutibacter sp.]NOR27539.1 hypothetical protein [Lutibacter sp.]